MVNNTMQSFTDEHHNTHQKKDVLGRGGQGIVYRTSDPDIAIKLATIKDSDKPIIDEQEIKIFQRKIQYIRLLPISDEINITKPMAMLKTSAGYVMHLLDEMQPISNMWPNAKNMVENKDVPEWLAKVDKKFANQLIHYQNTGGLRKRLIVLAKCAATISQLHSMGLIYGDISAENLFISKYPDSNEVWLIDPDNISFYKPGKTKGVYTPKYGAPEIVQVKDGCSFNSDCYSFAILAFWLITLNHPLIGDYVRDGGSDWANDTQDDEDLDEKAYAGLLPWIDDEKDDSNHTGTGLPRILVLNEQLRNLFQLTFGTGRTVPWKRPAIWHWTEALTLASDNTLECTDCKMSFFYKEDVNVCPYCKNTNLTGIIIFKSYSNNNESASGLGYDWFFVRELTSSQDKINLPERIFFPFSTGSFDKVMATIYLKDENVELMLMDPELQMSLAINDDKEKKTIPAGTPVSIPLSELEKEISIYVNGKYVREIKCLLI